MNIDGSWQSPGVSDHRICSMAKSLLIGWCRSPPVQPLLLKYSSYGGGPPSVWAPIKAVPLLDTRSAPGPVVLAHLAGSMGAMWPFSGAERLLPVLIKTKNDKLYRVHVGITWRGESLWPLYPPSEDVCPVPVLLLLLPSSCTLHVKHPQHCHPTHLQLLHMRAAETSLALHQWRRILIVNLNHLLIPNKWGNTSVEQKVRRHRDKLRDKRWVLSHFP